MNTSEYVLAKFLQCDPFKTSCLDSITMDVDDFFDDAAVKTLEGLCENVYQKALTYLTSLHQFAVNKIKSDPNAYQGSVLKWDSALLKDSLEFLNPEKDLHWGIDRTDFYMELDYYDLYWSVVETINDDFGSGFSFREFDSSFTKELWGGEKTPAKYDSLLL